MTSTFTKFAAAALYFQHYKSQYRNYTPQYKQKINEQTNVLQEQIQSNKETNLLFYPERQFLYADNYVFDYPLSADFRIGILVDPCRYNNYDCCINVFGSPEYPSLINPKLTKERVYQYDVLATEEEVSSNYILVYEDGSTIPAAAQRSADDNAVFDTNCISAGYNYTYCQGRNYALQRSSLRPPCMDNNSTLNSLAGCKSVNGTNIEKCVQIAFTSNTFVPQCEGDDFHCGTFMEIHMAHGSPYQKETELISDSRIEQRNVTGYYSTVLPLTWMNNHSKVLCYYTESQFRIGSKVYINPTAPICCCPPSFDASKRVGSFQCPKGPNGNGVYAYRPKNLANTLIVDTLMLEYPFCPIDLSANFDRMYCSFYDTYNQRNYISNCSTRSESKYDGVVCPYFDSCALSNSSNTCDSQDFRFTFIGQVGIITALDNEAVIPQVWITFNDNRTSYQFSQKDVVLDTDTKSMYEIWWVVRSKTDFTVQKRKGFNVTSPLCTFDTTNNRYFPYTILKNGVPLEFQ